MIRYTLFLKKQWLPSFLKPFSNARRYPDIYFPNDYVAGLSRFSGYEDDVKRIKGYNLKGVLKRKDIEFEKFILSIHGCLDSGIE